ncbi:hypothetical protein BCR44DRAFT_265828 [Catenaria anguillulae PL171]|uniref:Uncharacterized protein n=1 Tax=Catenaria anguillulae PL171 TaxID=765915 RepID=A0A1Y2H7G0_9FUNG|nr:hypothetical protein BCR44DRAFT_265828 [Catenaria anguillulae PL171]
MKSEAGQRIVADSKNIFHRFADEFYASRPTQMAALLLDVIITPISLLQFLVRQSKAKAMKRVGACLVESGRVLSANTIRTQTLPCLHIYRREQAAKDPSIENGPPYTIHVRSVLKALIKRDVILRRLGMRGDVASGVNELANYSKVKTIALGLLENGASTKRTTS